MKLLKLLPLVAVSTALIVIPDEGVIERVQLKPTRTPKSLFEKISGKFGSHYQKSIGIAENALDTAVSATEDLIEKGKGHGQLGSEAFDVKAWLDSASNTVNNIDPFVDGDDGHPGRPPHPPHPPRPPHPPQPPRPPRPPHPPRRPRPPHHKKPHHGHEKPNQTIYELISNSKYTTKFAKVINHYDDIVELLNSTTANYTVFAPTDEAFKLHPHPHKRISRDIIKAILKYHITPDLYPVHKIGHAHTIPSSLTEDKLGGQSQRLRIGFSLRGLNINFISHFKAVNIGATNGIIHAVDHILLPPPPIQKIISLLPGEFSTLQLALTKTGLDQEFAKLHATGATFFAPSNRAFKQLGPKVNAFLFSPAGEKHLKALLQYHIVANQTLYSDAFYHAKELDVSGLPLHVDLPTLLHGKSIGVDIIQFGRLLNMRLNGYNDVAVLDGIARDGVLQIPGRVLIPPKVPGAAAESDGEELSVEDFMSRFDGFVEDGEEGGESNKDAYGDL